MIAKTCLNCSRPINQPELAAKRAPHQRFCCVACRQEWHSAQRKLAQGLAAALGGKIDQALYDRVSQATGVGRGQVMLVVQALAAIAGGGV